MRIITLEQNIDYAVDGINIAEPDIGETLWVSSAVSTVDSEYILTSTHRVYKALDDSTGRQPDAYLKISDYDVYDSTVTYTKDAKARTVDGVLYKSLQDSNTGNLPNTSTDFWVSTIVDWEELRGTNKYAMLDPITNTQTTSSANITFSVDTSLNDSLGFFNLTNATSIQVVSTKDKGEITEEELSNKTIPLKVNTVSSWLEYVTQDPYLAYKGDVVITIPARVNVTTDITINGNDSGTDLGVGVFTFGKSYEAGITRYGASAGINDFSTTNIDSETGNVTLKQGVYQKRNNYSVFVNPAKLSILFRKLVNERARPAIYDGGGEREAFLVYGFYRSFEEVVSDPSAIFCSLELESIT